MSSPPAAELDSANPPSVRLELEADWKTSVQEVWAKIKSTQAPTKDDWGTLIAAERINRQMWLESEASGKKRRGSKKEFLDLMHSSVGEDGQLVPPAPKKKSRRKRTVVVSNAS